MTTRLQSIRRALNPTLSDTQNNTEPTRSIYFNAGGTVRLLLVDMGSSTVDYVVQAGQRIPVSALRVNSTGTTIANTNIIMEY